MNSVKKISVELTYELRKEVLRKNIDLPYKFSGDLDETTFHLGAFKEEVLVGVVSFMKSPSNNMELAQYQLRGMATLPLVRGEGFGNLLISEGIKLVQEKEIETIWCNARKVAVGFYKKNGFKVEGTSFSIEKVGIHYKMKKFV